MFCPVFIFSLLCQIQVLRCLLLLDKPCLGELSIGLETMVLTVNTEKILLGNMLVQVIKKAF